jgi:cytochrome P450
MLPRMRHIALEIIVRTVFGVDDADGVRGLSRELSSVLRLGDLPMSTLWMGHLSERPERQKTWPWRKFLAPRARADELLYREIATRRARLDVGERKDVLGLLLDARDEDGHPMTDEEVRDELVTALVAGHETTAITLAWAFESILSHPEVLGRLREELATVVKGDDGSLDLERLGELSYLDAIIKETLRLRPVIAVVGRLLQRPMNLAGFEVPANTIVTPCVHLAHHDPEYYSDPEAFRPERFLGGNPEPDIWLPFGGGIRRCIGAAFAMLEMKVVLATVLSQHVPRLLDETPSRVVRRAIAFAPRGGVRVAWQPG